MVDMRIYEGYEDIWWIIWYDNMVEPPTVSVI